MTLASVVDPRLTSCLYRESKDRITALTAGFGDATWNTPVAACPGWSVRDVVAHLTAVADGWVDAHMAGPPTDAETAAQIRRFDGRDVAEILAVWAAATEKLDRLVADEGIAPPLGDIASHEHDVRAALGRPSDRDSGAVWWSSDRLLANLGTAVPLRVTVEDGEYRSGPEEGPEIGLRTTRFEALRWRTGRRSRAQLAAMDWSGDPTPVLDQLYLFGPAASDFVE
jgi:uncharacterized protein (TIGR03083 family)